MEKKTKFPLAALFIAAAIVIFTAGLVISVKLGIDGFVKYKSNASGGITATGSASVDFKSDMATWGATISAQAPTTREAYAVIEQNAAAVKQYLIDSGIKETDISFLAISTYELTKSLYNDTGMYIGEEFTGYRLWQDVYVSSRDVDKVEEVSRDITKLISQGIDISPGIPAYYYSDLDSLKLDLIEQATDNARQRVEIIADGSGSEVGKLQNATLGVFQITATHSASDEFSSTGTLNTWSMWKTASITVKLYYAID